MDILLDILKGTIRFLFTLFAPLILIGLGALLSGWSIHHEYEVLAWTGLLIIGAGIFWGVIVYRYYISPHIDL